LPKFVDFVEGSRIQILPNSVYSSASGYSKTKPRHVLQQVPDWNKFLKREL